MRTLFLLACLFCSSLIFSQKAQKALDILFDKYPQEKVILCFSKNDYLSGETIFYKAYVLTGYEPSSISTNLYVELYDKQRQVIKKQLIPLLQGSGEGGFALPAALAEDVYYVRAYTNYMLNFDEAFQYIRPIAIYNPVSINKLVSKPVKWTAAAFAEGDALLNEVPCTVTVRLFANGTLPGNWQGTLYEKATNTAITNVEVFNNEVGSIRFVPLSEKDYTVVIKDNFGNQQVIDLPKATESGVALYTKVTGDKLEYTIYTKNVVGNAAGYKLIGTIHDQTAFVATVTKSTGILGGKIDISNLPSSVLRLTLFDEKEQPLNERLCFIHQQVKINQPTFSMDTLSFKAKGMNYWQMDLDSISWNSYFVQVADADYPLINTFLSDLYLSSDFTSLIYNAQWYLQDVDEQKKAALDALLISEKWHRFNWKDLLNGRFPVLHFRPERYLNYTASVRKGKSLQPNRDINLVFRAKDSSVQFVQVKTDSAGTFTMNDIVFVDTMKVYYQANNKKFLEREVRIDFELQNKFRPYQKAFPQPLYETTLRGRNDSLPAHIKWAALQRNNEMVVNEKAKMMEEVVIRTKARNATEELNNKLSSGLFSTHNEIVFDFINEDQVSALSYSNILEWLQGRVPGFSIFRSGGVAIPYLRGGVTQLFLDEMAVEPDVIDGLPVTDIAMIKVIRGIFLGGRNGGNGAIAIYTKRGDMASRFSTPSLPNNFLVGYSQLPVYYFPDYSDNFSTLIPDQRQILFWNTLPYPSSAGLRTPVRFYNNDQAKKFRLLISGFTNQGVPVHLDRVIQ